MGLGKLRVNGSYQPITPYEGSWAQSIKNPPRGIVMNYKIAHACGTDAANRNMRMNGRSVWNEEDANIAASTLNRLYPVEVELGEQR